MSTRIAVFCDKLLEAGWLAALIIAPLFFDVYSSRVFEPDKISLVRSIAVLMVAAWIIKRLEAGLPRQSIREFLGTVQRENPLTLPTAAMVAVYIIATIFSVAPSVSVWGSYQRLQGTYSTFSYIVIFLLTASSLRTRTQLHRVINTALVVSFPIAFYGILQHYKLDPLPWGGDVTIRVAANMGNAIFVGAYLILVVPLALARGIETLIRLTREMNTRGRALASGIAMLALVALVIAWSVDFGLGVSLAIVLYVLAILLALFARVNLRDVLVTATMVVILGAQLVAIFFTQSRGPWLGLAGGLFAFAVLYALARGARRVVFGSIGLAMLGAAFLIVFNLPSSPLASLKQVPYVGRLGEILDSKSPTAQVRELIWQGAIQLILPHEPLWSPTTGNDPFNAIRPLVGYGPEAMYVAYNNFYPPELGQVEQRNASPDRSHNETFDSLVMTGLLGFGAYILLFISIFYFGLKWLGVITTAGERNAFIALWLLGGFVSAAIFAVWRGPSFIGVALPAGMIAGLFIFLIVDVVRRSRIAETDLDLPRALWLCALLAALIGHFIEIHFGIAIASTRTYFWVYAALLVILGMNRLDAPSPAAAPEAKPVESPEKKDLSRPAASLTAREKTARKKRRRAVEPARSTARSEQSVEDMPLMPLLAWTAITALILLTLAFDFINNQGGATSALEAVRRSLFFIGDQPSYGVVLLFVFTWTVAGVLGFGQELQEKRLTRNGLGISVALFVVLTLTVLVWYILFMLRWLTQTGDLTDGFISILGLFYVSVALLVAAIAFCLSFDLFSRTMVFLRSAINAAVAPALLFAIIGIIYMTNYTVVSADILYKAGMNADSSGAWDRSVSIYQRALVLQPTQDFYDLFLGRAYLESARAQNDPAQRTQLLTKSEQALLTAQGINPLNTDHAANLARLHRIWGSLSDNPAQKAEHYRKSSEYYAMATRLSPNTVTLYNEWSQTYFQSGEQDKTREVLEKSLNIDPRFTQTYIYLGEYYRSRRDPDLSRAAEYYWEALGLDSGALSESDGTLSAGPLSVLARPEFAPHTIELYRAASQAAPQSAGPHLALADVYKQLGQPDQVRQELEAAIRVAPKDYVVRLTLVNYYSETGQIDGAVNTMGGLMALVSSNTSDYQRFQAFYTQLQNLQKAIQVAQKSPDDVNAHRSLAAMWKARGQAQFAVPEYQVVARLAPNDYDAQKNLALLNLQLNHIDDAQRALTTAVALAPDADKPIWQNLQAALNAQKSQQLGEALKQAQAALALSAEADRPALQAYVGLLQDQINGK